MRTVSSTNWERVASSPSLTMSFSLSSCPVSIYPQNTQALFCSRPIGVTKVSCEISLLDISLSVYEKQD